MITIALPKGRLSSQTLNILKSTGLTSIDIDEDSRKLVFIDNIKNYKFILVKPFDVPTYVEYGIADIGVVGKDVLMEVNKKVYEILDLKIGKCYLAIAGPKGKKEIIYSKNKIRVASKFQNISFEYFKEAFNQEVEIINLNGSVELAPILGLSDLIIDIVESGRTLEENNLEVYDKLYDISARMIINRVSLKLKKKAIDEVIQTIERWLDND